MSDSNLKVTTFVYVGLTVYVGLAFSLVSPKKPKKNWDEFGFFGGMGGGVERGVHFVHIDSCCVAVVKGTHFKSYSVQFYIHLLCSKPSPPHPSPPLPSFPHPVLPQPVSLFVFPCHQCLLYMPSHMLISLCFHQFLFVLFLILLNFLHGFIFSLLILLPLTLFNFHINVFFLKWLEILIVLSTLGCMQSCRNCRQSVSNDRIALCQSAL